MALRSVNAIVDRSHFMPKCLYVFADETGDDVFSADGTEWYCISAYITETPVVSAALVHDLLYTIQAEGLTRKGNSKKPGTAGGDPYSTFHATYDGYDVRKRMFALISGLEGHGEAYTAMLNKRKMNPSIRSKTKMYEITAGAVAKFVAKAAARKGYEHVVFAYDQALTGKKLNAFKATIKPILKATGMPYTLLFQQLGHEPNGQIADYIAWANHRALHAGDDAHKKTIANLTQVDFDLYRRGTTVYY